MFIFAVIPAVLSAAAVLYVQETPRPATPPSTTTTIDLNPQRLPRSYWLPFAILTTFSFINFSDALLIVRARHLGLSVTEVIAAYALYNLVYSAASYPAGVLADRVSKLAIIATGFAVFGISYTVLGLVTKAFWVWPVFALYGLDTALTDGVAKAWIATTVGPRTLGRGLGFQSGAAGIGAIVAGVWAGLAWHESGRGPLLVSGIASLSLAVGLFVANGETLTGGLGRRNNVTL